MDHVYIVNRTIEETHIIGVFADSESAIKLCRKLAEGELTRIQNALRLYRNGCELVEKPPFEDYLTMLRVGYRSFSVRKWMVQK